MVVMMTIIIVFVPPQEGQGRVWGAGRRSRGQEEGWQYSQRCLPRVLRLCLHCIWMLMMIMMMLTKMMRPANVLCRLGRSMPSWMASHSYTGALSYLFILMIGGYCRYISYMRTLNRMHTVVKRKSHASSMMSTASAPEAARGWKWNKSFDDDDVGHQESHDDLMMTGLQLWFAW